MTFQDKIIRCSSCGANFVFSVEEQQIFTSWGLANKPRHCPSCRNAGKADRHSHVSYRHGASQQMFSATCATCGRDTRVPFEPRTGRRVYCRDCYHKVTTSR